MSPCSPPDPHRVETGVRMLRGWGLRTEVAWDGGERPPEIRAAEMQQALESPGVHAVLVTRAGKGAEELLPLLDFSVLERQPKPVCGFSDVTFLHHAIAAAVRRPSFHTPELAWSVRLNGEHSAASLRETLLGEASGLQAGQGVVRSRGPAVTGRLRGGNLSALARIDATAAAKGDILFLEELRETPQTVGELLNRITARGHLAGVSAVVFGQFVECGDAEQLRAVLDDWCERSVQTVLAGIPAGHGVEQETMAMGWPVSVEPATGTLSYVSSPTDAGLTW
ncbi:LD-carboxypeptidase [Plantactinospora sp. KBS50]|uniref:S66 peptidase family protein n=1 Tax=Plantactinospora sp. KBS50 TaxID=2024580 RepID=UPI0012FD61A2|nr:LD-carboxypeptidase [Plantactinospora sp. KBS50]